MEWDRLFSMPQKIIDRLMLPKKTCRSSGAWLDQPGRHTINMALLAEFGDAAIAINNRTYKHGASFGIWPPCHRQKRPDAGHPVFLKRSRERNDYGNRERKNCCEAVGVKVYGDVG